MVPLNVGTIILLSVLVGNSHWLGSLFRVLSDRRAAVVGFSVGKKPGGGSHSRRFERAGSEVLTARPDRPTDGKKKEAGSDNSSGRPGDEK